MARWHPKSPEALVLLTLATCGGAHGTRAEWVDIEQVLVEAGLCRKSDAEALARRTVWNLVNANCVTLGDVRPGLGIVKDRQFMELALTGAKDAAVLLFEALNRPSPATAA